MPSLRGHHLICLHFFYGEGYGPDFIRNLGITLKTIEYTAVKICSGADDICRKCPYLINDTCNYDKNAEDDINNMDSKALALLNLSAGNEVSWTKTREMLPSIFTQWYESYCNDCDWLKVCEKNGVFQSLLLDKL